MKDHRKDTDTYTRKELREYLKAYEKPENMQYFWHFMNGMINGGKALETKTQEN